MPKVFLVEDESTLRSTLRDTVPWGQLGYTFVGEATDGEMALPLISSTHPDVLITDIKMPFMDGLSLSKLVLKDFPNTKIIIISGYDDFEYARQAVEIGAFQYLLKPITKATLMDVLRDVKEKIDQENEQRNYQAQFQQDSQEYEQFARRNFMEQVVAGKLSVQQIYEDAGRLGVELRAQSYCLMLFSVLGETYSETDSKVREDLLAYFMKRPEYLLLRWNLTTYMVLIKADKEELTDGLIHSAVAAVESRYSVYDGQKPWYVAVGSKASRLSQLPECYEDVSRLWAYRYIQPDSHVLTSDTVKGAEEHQASSDLSRIDVSKFNTDILLEIMRGASLEEIPSIIGELLLDISDAVGSQPFCHYVMLSTRFTAVSFMTSIGLTQEDLTDDLTCLDLTDKSVTMQDLRRYLTEIIMKAVKLRVRSSAGQYRDILLKAAKYIDTNYTDENLSLNSVAKEVNISANYLSAVFSQEMECTFVEYVTQKRMARAKELLRCTDKHSGEIANEVGYKDPHYFSFLFKKTQGQTPREYRAGGRK